jgi:hypothetical protein
MFTEGFEKTAGLADAAKNVAKYVGTAMKSDAFKSRVKGNAIKGAVGGGIAGAVHGGLQRDENGKRGGFTGALKGGALGAAGGGALGAASPYVDAATTRAKRLFATRAGGNMVGKNTNVPGKAKNTQANWATSVKPAGAGGSAPDQGT